MARPLGLVEKPNELVAAGPGSDEVGIVPRRASMIYEFRHYAIGIICAC